MIFDELFESNNSNQRTALALAQEIYANMVDLVHISAAGATTGAGNSANAQSLRAETQELMQQLDQLGYNFDAKVPGYIRPLTVDNEPQAKLTEMQCVECGGPAFSDLIVAEKKDACYNKVRSRYKVWPSAYASGALVQCRKKGAANWGNKSKNESVEEARAATAAFRAGNKKRTELNAMSDKERRDYDREQQEKQRRRDDARLEREREKNAAKKGVAEDKDMCSVCGQTPCNCTHILEGLADDFMKMAKDMGMNPRRAGTPAQERERTQQIMAQRAKERAEQEKQIAQADAARLPELQAEYDDMMKKYQSLGGNNWQYADREQNLSDREREARAMEPELQRRRAQLARAKAHAGADKTQTGNREGAEEHQNNEIAESLRRLREADPTYTGIDPVVRQRMGMPPASQDEIRNFLDKNPPVVRSGTGEPIQTGTGGTVQSGGAVDVARAADAASPDRAQAMAKPPGTVTTTATAPAPSSTPQISAATTAPVKAPSVTPTPIPPAKPPAPSFSKAVSSLASANKIADPNKINVGQTIKLPSGQDYTVAKGDTLSGIAAGKFKGATTPTTTPSASTPAPKPTTTPTPSVKSNTTTPIKPSDIPGIGSGDVAPKKSPYTGRNPELQAGNKLPISVTNTLSVPDTTPPVMFNRMAPGSLSPVTKESSDIARIKNLAGLK